MMVMMVEVIMVIMLMMMVVMVMSVVRGSDAYDCVDGESSNILNVFFLSSRNQMPFLNFQSKEEMGSFQ
jgi:hypothetical protein